MSEAKYYYNSRHLNEKERSSSKHKSRKYSYDSSYRNDERRRNNSASKRKIIEVHIPVPNSNHYNPYPNYRPPYQPAVSDYYVHSRETNIKISS